MAPVQIATRLHCYSVQVITFEDKFFKQFVRHASSVRAHYAVHPNRANNKDLLCTLIMFSDSCVYIAQQFFSEHEQQLHLQ